MSSHDELNKAISHAFSERDRELQEARAEAAEHKAAATSRAHVLNEIRNILAGDDGPEDKLAQIGELLK